MTYLWEAMKETKTIRRMVFYVVINSICTFMGLMQMGYLTKLFEYPSLNSTILAMFVLVLFGNIPICIIKRGHYAVIGKVYTYMTNKFSKKCIEADYEFHVKYSPGELQSIYESINEACGFVLTIMNIVTYTGKVIVILATICSISITVGFTLLIIELPLLFVMRAIFIKFNSVSRDFSASKRKRSKIFDESLNGFREIKSFNMQQTKQKEYETENSNAYRLFNSKITLSRITCGVVAISDNIGTLVSILIVFYLISNGSLTTTTGLQLILYAMSFVDPIVDIASELADVSDAMAKFEMIDEILGYHNTVPTGHIELQNFNNGITLNNVSFQYDKSSKILCNVSLKINKGQHIGICGATGEGKSTLLKLLGKCYLPNSGRLTIDGIDLKDISEKSISEYIGYVHQDTFIFDGTIRSNITFGRNISDIDLREACELAKVDEFVNNLPNKYDTVVGPRGIKLSGGQQQRIALARLFLQNPPIYLLDEATSALDNSTEQFVKDALENLKGKTVITVAHRLSTIQNCDKIVVIENHTIKEQGTHEELMALKGKYWSMWTRQ